MITLEAARTLDRITRIALYEPPCYPAVIALDQRRARPGSTFRDLLPVVRYDFHDVATVDSGIVINGTGHDGPCSTGNPHAVATALTTFFA